MDAEAALAAELLDSRRRAEELQALLDAERRRAAEAESQLRERERLLQEAQRKPIDKELAEKQRAVLSQDLLALKQHSQRFSNASGAVEVVIPGLHANAATVQAGITAHFATLHELLHRREDKMHALVEALLLFCIRRCCRHWGVPPGTRLLHNLGLRCTSGHITCWRMLPF